MNCYRDMTFCSGDGCAKFGPCYRSLTKEVKDGADKAGLMIAQFEDPTELPCWTGIEEVTEEDPTQSLF